MVKDEDNSRFWLHASINIDWLLWRRVLRITLTTDWLLLEGYFAQAVEKINKNILSSYRQSVPGSRKGPDQAQTSLRIS